MVVIENVLPGCDPTPSLSPSPSPSPSSSPPPPWQAMKVDQPVPWYKRWHTKLTPCLDDHNLKPTQQQQRTTGRRPRLNLDEFFDTTTATTATATADDADTFRMVARAFQQLEADGGGGGGGEPTSLVRMIVEALLGEAEAGAEASGVPDGFTDTLDRVPRGRLGRGDVCPICNSPFLDDPYPLVVRLPCHPSVPIPRSSK